MKGRILLAIVTVVVMVVGGWWLRHSKETNHATKGVTLPIGVILPLSDDAAALGKPTLNGIILAIDSYNQARAGDSASPQIRLVAEDDKASAPLAVAAFQKLVRTDDVKIVLGPLTSGGVLAVAAAANANRVVVLSPGGSAPNISQAGDYVFRNELSEAFGAKRQAEIAVEQLGFKRIAVLFINNDYGLGTVQVFRERVRSLGATICADEGFSEGTVDFKSTLLKIKATKPDTVFVVFQSEMVNLVRQWHEMGRFAPIYTTPVFEDNGLLTTLGPLAEGILYTYYGAFDVQQGNELTMDFVRRYSVRFGVPPSYYAAQGFDAAGLALAALKASHYDQTAVASQLAAIRDYPGVTGTMSMDANGDVSKPVVLKTVKGGAFVRY